MDKDATLVIHAKIDDFMRLLMKKLNLDIPDFKLERYAKVVLNKNKLKIFGTDYLGGPYEIFKKVTLNGKSELSLGLINFKGAPETKVNVEMQF